jgi:hypothetical protein
MGSLRMSGMRRFAPLVVLRLVACSGSASARPTSRLDGYGLSVRLARGWHGLAGPGQLQAADFPLARDVLGSAELAHVPRGHVHLIVWDYGPAVPYLAFPAGRAPLALGRRDITAGPMEGFRAGDVYAMRSALLGEEQLQVVADLGPKPLAANSLQKLDRVLGTLRVQPPRVLLPVTTGSHGTGSRCACFPAGRGGSRSPPTRPPHSSFCVRDVVTFRWCCSRWPALKAGTLSCRSPSPRRTSFISTRSRSRGGCSRPLAAASTSRSPSPHYATLRRPTGCSRPLPPCRGRGRSEAATSACACRAPARGDQPTKRLLPGNHLAHSGRPRRPHRAAPQGTRERPDRSPVREEVPRHDHAAIRGTQRRCGARHTAGDSAQVNPSKIRPRVLILFAVDAAIHLTQQLQHVPMAHALAGSA